MVLCFIYKLNFRHRQLKRNNRPRWLIVGNDNLAVMIGND